MSGWFAMKHGISRHHLFKGRPERMAVWVWLVDNAAYKDTPHDINGKTITVKRGQVAASLRHIASETGVSIQTVRTFIKRLADDHMINTASTHGKNVITLCNYEKYQSSPNASNTPTNTASTQHQHTKEQVNNIPVGEGEKSPPDPAAIIFSSGIKILMAAGKSREQAGSILGMWRKRYGDAELIAAIGRTEREGAIDPVGFIEGCFRFKAKSQAVERKGTTNAGAFGSIPEVC